MPMTKLKAFQEWLDNCPVDFDYQMHFESQTNNCIVIALRVEKGVGVADPYLPTADPSKCLRRAGFDCTRDFSFSNLDALEELLLFEY